MFNLAEAGCLYMLAQDGYGNGYHRYFWSGQEPPLNAMTFSPVPTSPGRSVGIYIDGVGGGYIDGEDGGYIVEEDGGYIDGEDWVTLRSLNFH